MICKLLKIFKVASILTATFQSNTTITTDHRHQVVAITHQLNYPAFHLHENVVLLQDKKYIPCFIDKHEKYIVLPKDHLGLEVEQTD
jgi:hypothetical protein